MATIQIRDIPEEAYETIRSRAHERGMSIQAYMRQCVIEDAASPKPEDLWTSVRTLLRSEDTPGTTIEQAVEDVRAIRDE